MSNTTTKTNTTFRGIKRNAKTNFNTSTDDRYIERLQRKVMNNLYTTIPVVQRVNVTGKDEFEVEYQEIGNAPLLKYFNVNQETMTYNVKRYDDNGVCVGENEVITGPKEDYRLYNGIVIASFKEAERFYDYYKINGITVDGKYYRVYLTSSSMEKHSTVYFAEISKEHTLESRIAEVNELSGGILTAGLQEEMDYDDLAKLNSRLCLNATTPSLWHENNKTRNVFIFNGEILSKPEFTDEVKQTLAQYGVKIGENFGDGYFNVSDEFVVRVVESFIPDKVTLAQARKMSLQIRVRVLTGKGHVRVLSQGQKVRKMQALYKRNPEACIVYCDGKLVDLRLLSEKEKVEVFKKIDIIGDTDAFKKINYNKLNAGEYCEVGIVNMSNLSSGNKLSNQSVFKISSRFPEETEAYIKKLTESTVDQFLGTPKGKLSFKNGRINKGIKLDGTVYDNCIRINEERAASDDLINRARMRDIDTYVLPQVAGISLKINSAYMRMVPEDTSLNNWNEALGSRIVEYTSPSGKTYEVRALEIYSNSFNNDWHELKAMGASKEVLDNYRVSIGIKFPSQGEDEFEVFYNLTMEDIMLKSANGLITEEHKQFFRECPNNCVILPCDNIMKNALAGSDFDGDDLEVIYNHITIEEDGEISLGLTGTDDITALCIRKRAEDGCGRAALIEYKDENGNHINKDSYHKPIEVENYNYNLNNKDELSRLFGK